LCAWLTCRPTLGDFPQISQLFAITAPLCNSRVHQIIRSATFVHRNLLRPLCLPGLLCSSPRSLFCYSARGGRPSLAVEPLSGSSALRAESNGALHPDVGPAVPRYRRSGRQCG
jgi:hypothetical protein